MDAEIKSMLERIDRKLSVLITEKKKPSWVRASVVMEMTGWNKYQMQNARENAYIEFKQEDGLWYNINSLNEIFIKESHKPKASTN